MTEQVLFEMYKDTSKLVGQQRKDILREKYPNVDISSLYEKVVNYQIKKYGSQLYKDKGKIQNDR